MPGSNRSAFAVVLDSGASLNYSNCLSLYWFKFEFFKMLHKIV
ncbi:MAG: hypothetical protein OFPII_33650 [Osedax symbiont Rs1]|nr:MAG: hypothetical protein OFPII_33650 [Osedax symbiont Rs1]